MGKSLDGWILAADPGLHTGLVFVDPRGEVDDYATATSLEEIEHFMDDKGGPGTLCVIESFAGGGFLSSAANTTLHTLGFIHGYAVRKGMTVKFQAPQARLAFEGIAKMVFPGHEERHERSALAHAARARTEMGT